MNGTGDIDVLHVDDEPDFVEVAADMLEREDSRFSVETATSASAGLHRLAVQEFDCIVSDYQMPEQNGIEFLEAIREEYSDLPFILFTGKGSEEVASDAFSAGATDYLQKGPGTGQYELLATRIMTAVRQYRAERELERQNDLLRKSQDLADVGAWEYNPQDQEIYFTDMVYEIYGVGPAYEPEPEKDIQKFYHPDDRDTVRTAVEEALQSGTEYDIEVRITAGDGTDKWIRTRGTPQVEDGTVQCVRGTIQDITERKEREQELQELKSQYETLAENFPGGAVFLIDTDLTYVRAGGEELSKVGLSPDDVEGKTPHALFPEDIADEICHYYEEALDGNTNTFEQAYEGERYRIQTAPIRTDGEEISHVMAVSQNVTERVEDKQHLEAKNERLEEFVSIVSHDLRNPLSVAQGNLELAQEVCESDRLTSAADAIDRSQALIEDLLTLAREGKEVDETESVDLAEVVESSWQTTETQQATLDADASQVIEADRSRLQQLFENLYRNSVEHGGEDVTVIVGAMDDGFYVADTGTGIPDGDHEEVFGTGYSTSDEGTGFGLRIVEQTADAHGWTITVTESEQSGARFEFTGVQRADR